MSVWDTTPPPKQRGAPDSRLIWRSPEVPIEELPNGVKYANVPKGMVVCRETGFASSRVYRWPAPLGGYTVALGVVAGPHPRSRYFAGTLQAAVDVAEALVTERLLPALTDEEMEGDEPSDGPTPEVSSLGDMLAASLAKLKEDGCD